jgi:hypothetical protein
MNFKRYGQDQHEWNPLVRYTVHDCNGDLVSPGMQWRKECKDFALSLGNGYWVKDNINNYFYFGVHNNKIKKIRCYSFSDITFKNLYPSV